MTALPQGLTPSTWALDPAHTEAAFSVRHAGIAKVRGRFTELAGTIVLGDDLESSSVTAEIQAASIDSANEGRDNHLRSGDFLDVEAFPTMTFVSTTVREHDDAYQVDGDFTLHGVMLPVTLDLEFEGTASDPMGNERIGYSATTKISRKDYGLTWNAALEAGGVLVGDLITITLDVSAIKQ